MSLIANDLSRFGRDISDYENLRKSIVNNYEMLVTHMNDLNKMWQGEAHNELLKTFAVDSKRTLEMLNLLNEVYGKLQYANNEYTNCENTVASIIDSIAV